MKYLFSFVVITLILFPFGISRPARASEAASKRSAAESTPIALTIGNKVVPAILYNTAPARDLLARLPVTVSLNRGPVDYCGGIAPIDYGNEDVRAGYRSGDLAYWIPGQDFVIFTETEKASSGAPDLVIIGQIKADITEVRDLGSTIEVTIALDR